MNIQGEWTLLIHVTSNKEHEILPHICQPHCPAVYVYNYHSKVVVRESRVLIKIDCLGKG